MLYENILILRITSLRVIYVYLKLPLDTDVRNYFNSFVTKNGKANTFTIH